MNPNPYWQDLRRDLMGFLLVLGSFLAIFFLVISIFYEKPGDYLDEPLFQVRGTIEGALPVWERGNGTVYEVWFNDECYVLEEDDAYFSSFCDFSPESWCNHAEGQTVQLTVSKGVDVFSGYDGVIYGIRDESGVILLDEKLYRQVEYEEVKADYMTMPLVSATGFLILAVGLFLKFVLKW